MLDQSPWPLLSSVSIFSSMISLYMFLSLKCSVNFVIFCLISLTLVVFQWFRDILRESTFQGCHSSIVQKGLSLGFIMFIVSEVMFFFSFFFSYFFISLNPDIELGMQWPPLGIETLNFYQVPLLNTVILLSSGVSITWAHYSIIKSGYFDCMVGMILTIFLGIIFSYFQFFEYYECSFSMSDSVYGSLFFISTGFHGFHVIVGVCIIITMLVRLILRHFSSTRHLGFEFACWYWHFVDVVWLFLYVCIYWWGS